MKRVIFALIAVLFLCGCTGSDDKMERALSLRSRLLSGSVGFDATVSADYGGHSCSFVMACTADEQGNLTFTVQEPKSIAGISGSISATGGKLTFDGMSLAFELLADGDVSPVSAPWILVKTLRSGYLTSCGAEGELLRLAIDDSYEDDALHLDIWLGKDDVPVRGEVLWQGRRILSLQVDNFRFL